MTMASVEPLPLQPIPYTWDDAAPPPSESIQLWNEVGNGIDKSQTVVWKSAVESLEHAHKYLRTTEEARAFVEKYMSPIIGILVEQQPSKIGHHERNCVQESLALAVTIVAKDIDIQLKRKGDSKLIEVLTLIFNKKKAYYKGNKGNWNVNHLVGLPEVRMEMIKRFRAERGFELLSQYLTERINTPHFPRLDSLHQILAAISDAIPTRTPGTDHGPAAAQMEDDAIAVAKAVMEFIKSANDDVLKKIPAEQLSTVQHDLQRTFDRLISTRRQSTYEFYSFWRSLILKLITSQSLPLKLFGWEQMNDIIEASVDHGPPPRSFMVSGGGCTFVDGEYVFAGETTEDGYAQRGVEICYERRVPVGEDGAGKKLTLFRCTMRSQQKWWFLSEADEEQPGTDRDIDYYQHKSKEHEEAHPPPAGWVTCRNAGLDPPPTLQALGLLVPPGEEMNTLEHQLARWAIENNIIEQVLGDSVHREVVSRSTMLMKFLASMGEKYLSAEIQVGGGADGTRFCLRTGHLLLAWKTCTRKADAAVSAQIYQLLVSILPSCPSDLAIPLLKAVQTSLVESDEKRDYLNEVAEFCSALAAANSADAKPREGLMLQDDVREEVLKLLWAVLTHPDANTLKTYDSLKRYVTNELRVEPKGSEHRENFLQSCIQALDSSASKQEEAVVDEVQALRMVKLTRFVLEACPREQAHRMVTETDAFLPSLLFTELTAFLVRKQADGAANSFRKVRMVPILTGKLEGSSNGVELIPVRAIPSQVPPSGDASRALPERLRILRYVYGLSDLIVMSSNQLHSLWRLCSLPSDREEVMIFIASAASNGLSSGNTMGPGVDQATIANNVSAQSASHRTDELLSSAFTEEVCVEVFLTLFCAPDLSYEELGEGAYKSFQVMFSRLRSTSGGSQNSGDRAALDALWRICLTAGDSAVAAQAMKDLLSVYMSIDNSNRADNAWTQRQQVGLVVTEDNHVNFGQRVFGCLSNVKNALDEGQPGAERSAERCLRILNAAIGQSGGTAGSSMTLSTLARISSAPLDCSLNGIVKFLPHGMRGQACYRKVGIMAKRAYIHNQAGQVSHAYGPREEGQSSAIQPNKNSTTQRFAIDVHPLETLASVKAKVALLCHCNITSVKPVSVSGRLLGSNGRSPGGESQTNLNVVADDSIMDGLGIVQGSELVFQIVDRPIQGSTTSSTGNKNSNFNRNRDLSDIFFDDGGRFADKLFQTLLGVLEALPWTESDVAMIESSVGCPDVDTHKLVWDLLLAMPTNANIASRVLSTSSMASDGVASDEDAMEVDSPREIWSNVLDLRTFERSVYILLAVDALLQPSAEVLAILPVQQREILERSMQEEAVSFRRAFIDSGGFDAVVRFFSESEGNSSLLQSRKRMGNAVALRVLKCCLFGNSRLARPASDSATDGSPDEVGSRLLQSLSDADGLLKSLTSMVVGDQGISASTISDVLKFLRLLFRSPSTAQSFVSLPHGTAEQFLIALLVWEGEAESLRSASSMIGSAAKIRRNTHDLILQTSILADYALPWLIRAIDNIEVSSESTTEFFDVLQKLVGDGKDTARSRNASESELRDLGTTVCQKIASCPRPTNETVLIDFSTGVLCGCLNLLRALIETGGGSVVAHGTDILVREVGVNQWSASVSLNQHPRGVLATLTSSFSRSGLQEDDLALIDLMGAIFDGFLSPGGSSSVVAICCDKESRQKGFDVVGAAARSCRGGEGYIALVSRIDQLVGSAAPYIRHRWGQVGAATEGHSRSGRTTSKYSGLRNQGCTCYMNSVLQQLFMMPELRKSMCEAPLPARLRSTGGVISGKGQELVGKKLSMQWETAVSYDAVVEAFNQTTGMHTIRYCAIPVATVGGNTEHDQMQAEDIARLPEPLPDEFFLSEGRPGKETGVFEIVSNPISDGTGEVEMSANMELEEIKETEDEMSSRHLLEEVQKTFIHLDEGSRGRCFDPRALVEACGCLKLEFDVWQQNDASEFATKLLDRLEISLKRWAPSHFQYLDHTFGLKQTKQKICKECGLKTNREEKLLNIDCQIRGKADIHEALSTMTEVEIMEGNNRVFCDSCKKNTDTVLRTAISELPNMLILSLKRFDLDYNTFETVKLNSRCAFGQTLNMKRYTLEGLEAMELAVENDNSGESPMEISGGNGKPVLVNDPLNIPDDDYEYKLAGVLVHAGVAQGGHYYSFIKDRIGSQEQWYRFDDEDVTPFDPVSIEHECFGGKILKEQKWPNGQVHNVEQEQYANALMLFYEKVKPTDPPSPKKEADDREKIAITLKPEEISSGYDVFEPDVRRSNATHRWQTFLFDAEFQAFLKGMLGLCSLACGDHADPGSLKPTESSDTENSWRAAVVQMSLNFVFDVMLYASERLYLNEWVRMIEDTFAKDSVSARAFVHKLANKTREVSPNWLRTYLTECPDHAARGAAVRIFSSAVQACISFDEEQRVLHQWTAAWKDELASYSNGPPIALPCALRGKWQQVEDFASPSGSGASSIGCIISFVNVLTEILPRCWRYMPELSIFVRNIANVTVEPGGRVLRRAMLQAMVPARLMALVIRDKSHPAMRTAFPGASASVEIAETQMRAETNPVAHAMPLSGNHVMNSTDINSRGGSPVPFDFLPLIEAVGCLAGLRGVVHAPLLVDAEETRGRNRVALSKAAINALTTIFQESSAPGSVGMGQREIEMYLQRCGFDAANVPTQKIVDIMAKYPTTPSGNGSKGSNCLSLEGFLAYYKDTAQNREIQVRNDLHTFGFRPDLSRRSRESRILNTGDKEHPRQNAESVALDFASLLKSVGCVNVGPLAEYGLDSFYMFSVACSASEPLAEHVLAGTSYTRDCDGLIASTLKAIYHAPTGWPGNDTLNAAIMILRVLASVPDDFQQHRISFIMLCSDPPTQNAEHGAGLIVAARQFSAPRQSQHYSPNDHHYGFERYSGIVKELSPLHSVSKWLYDNRTKWSFMERDLFDAHHQGGNSQNQTRGNYTRENDSSQPLDHHSDSDMAGINESEEDEDDDSRFEEIEAYQPDLPSQIIVEGAGCPVVNGVYKRDGHFDNFCKYSRQGKYNNETVKFSLFRCNVSNNTQHWYISIVPRAGPPGTSTDIDFYSAPALDNDVFPPIDSWTKSNEGRDPPPFVRFSKYLSGGDGVQALAPSPPLDTPTEQTGRNGGPQQQQEPQF